MAQPFYHQASILFTATREISRDELTEALKIPGLVKLSPECEQVDAEPGDPADL